MWKLIQPRNFLVWLSLAFALFSILTSAQAEKGEKAARVKISVFGYEGVLEPMEVQAALDTIRALDIGDPPFLKEEIDAVSAGLASCLVGKIQKGERGVHFFRLQFTSEASALSALNQKRKATRKESPLSVEDPGNCRTPHFGLYFDGRQWSGYRRAEGMLVLLKGEVSQEDFFHIMEKAL